MQVRIVPAIVLLTLSLSASAQTDSLAIGGPEVASPYDAEYSVVNEDAAPLLTAEDSARVIPSYEIYGDFETDVIFERHAHAKQDSVNLVLSWSSCDHHFPIMGDLNSPFGPRRGRMHYGVDLDLEVGDSVSSAFEGMVRISRYHGQFGNVVVVRHANGLETLYGHLSERKVEVGDYVEAGQLLGLGGSTGRSTGPHLHFETRYLGQPMDPQLLFDVKNGELRSNCLEVHPGLFKVITPQHKARSTKLYRVRKGDTLSTIARRNGTTVNSLCSLNRISKRSKLRIGQRLRIRG